MMIHFFPFPLIPLVKIQLWSHFCFFARALSHSRTLSRSRTRSSEPRSSAEEYAVTLGILRHILLRTRQYKDVIVAVVVVAS